ncbi:MAG TPA: DUF502 domain-containing protein [Vicinamibacterales bacterium]|nr:DUF502 domain-containing protein [Vicinamibacterales bacterium]
MFTWLRRRFITGFFVTVPLFITVFALAWFFRVVDDATTPLYDQLLGRRIPGLGILSTAVAILVIGIVATNVLGRRLLLRAEEILLHVPVFKTIYSPLKQLIAAFSPDSASGFKRVVLVEHATRGYSIGFLTKEFTVNRGEGPQAMLAVYVPTNNLYLGDVVVCPRDRAVFPDITVEEGIRIFLTGGVALPPNVKI